MALNINSSGCFQPSPAYMRALEPGRVAPEVDKAMDDYVRNLKEQEARSAAIDKMQSTRVVGRNIDVYA